jgi:hypothetical protein
MRGTRSGGRRRSRHKMLAVNRYEQIEVELLKVAMEPILLMGLVTSNNLVELVGGKSLA